MLEFDLELNADAEGFSGADLQVTLLVEAEAAGLDGEVMVAGRDCVETEDACGVSAGAERVESDGGIGNEGSGGIDDEAVQAAGRDLRWRGLCRNRAGRQQEACQDVDGGQEYEWQRWASSQQRQSGDRMFGPDFPDGFPKCLPL